MALKDYFGKIKIWIRGFLDSVRRIILLDLKLGRSIRTPNPYESYDDYISWQKEKTLDPQRMEKWLGEEWEEKIEGFTKTFKRSWEYINDKQNALCLGSRAGQEVRALQILGLNAIGIDLVPFEPCTIEGDIHNLQFENDEFGLLFSNIFDHALYPEKFCSEMERVLMTGGIIILHLQIGEELDEFTETYVYSPDGVINLFSNLVVLESRAIQHDFDPMDWELVLKKIPGISK